MQEKKDILGKLFFILSIIFIIYTLLTPLNHLICHIDEYFTLTVTNLPVTDIITVTAGDVHPPLYYLMAKVVVEISKIFNLNILFNLKLLSTLAFVLIMAISATEIRRQYGWLAAGLFALALSVMSEFSIYYLIARMYSWTVLFILIAFLAFKNIIDNKNDKKSWIILTLFSVFAAYTHYFGAITSVCIYLILLIYLIRNKKNEIKNWVLSTITGIVIYIPWVFVLLGQLMKIKQDYWIPPVTLESFFRFIGYYAYTENIMFYIVSIGFLITIILIYRWESDNFAKKDQIIIISAFVAYFGTIFIGIAVSDLFTPVIDERYMMPAAALIWLSISIILAKIKNKKLFIVVLALICLLLLSGVANTFITFDQAYHDGTQQKEYFENIANNNNSVLIIGTQDDILFFLCCSTDIDTYCINESDVFGLNSQEIHRQYNYTDINESQIDEFISNNPDKDIYFLYWEETIVKSPIESEFTQFFMHFTKIK